MLRGDSAVVNVAVCPYYATCNNRREASGTGMMSRTRGSYHTELQRSKEQATDLQLTKRSTVLLRVLITVQDIPYLLWNPRVHTMFTTTCHWASAS
jgi:hypothetical protein